MVLLTHDYVQVAAHVSVYISENDTTRLPEDPETIAAYSVSRLSGTAGRRSHRLQTQPRLDHGAR